MALSMQCSQQQIAVGGGDGDRNAAHGAMRGKRAANYPD